MSERLTEQERGFTNADRMELLRRARDTGASLLSVWDEIEDLEALARGAQAVRERVEAVLRSEQYAYFDQFTRPEISSNAAKAIRAALSDPGTSSEEAEALEACREQRADLLALLDVEREQHADALRRVWHEGYGAGSSDATDGWLRPGSPRTACPYPVPARTDENEEGNRG